MIHNPALKRLGFAQDDRVVILHTDDIGMCEASVSAFAALHESGLRVTGSTMVPCAWFPHLAAYCRAHPEADMGVHITLTCEWATYRWGALSSCDPADGLLDAEGYMPRGNAEVHAQANPAAVAREMQAQVERALAAGIRITHIDTHMGTVMHPKLIGAYMELGERYGVPVMLPRPSEALRRAHMPDAAHAQLLARLASEYEERGLPLMDHIAGMPLDVEGEHADHAAVARRALTALQPGLTYFILHPAADTPELRAICRDWRARVANLNAFLHEDLRDVLRAAGAHDIGCRDLLPAR